MTFWCGSGSGSGSADPCLRLMNPDLDPDLAIFVIVLQDANKKLFLKNFCLLLFEGIVTVFFKDKKSKRSHKKVGIKVFLTIFDWWWKDPVPDPDPYTWLMDQDQDPGAKKHTDRTDPDPQHWFLRYPNITRILSVKSQNFCNILPFFFASIWRCGGLGVAVYLLLL
jgi:hypothetical protein